MLVLLELLVFSVAVILVLVVVFIVAAVVTWLTKR